MKISIALAVYNSDRHLEAQLDSYLRQRRQPDELVIGNDASTDRSIDILRNFSKISPFPVVIKTHDQNLGVVKNFEDAISRCSGDLIFLSDADDVWSPNKIERIVAEFDANREVGLVWSDAALVSEDLEPLHTTLWDGRFPINERKKVRNGGLIDVVLRQNVVGGATSAFRSEYRKWFTPIPVGLDLLHDGWIALIIGALADVRFIDETLMLYRQHGLQTSRVLFQKENETARNPRGVFEEGLVMATERLREAQLLLQRLQDLQADPLCNHNRIRDSIRVTEDQVSLANEAILHFSTRLSLSRNRIARFPKITQELMSGRYKQFSKGFRSAIKDLIIP